MREISDSHAIGISLACPLITGTASTDELLPAGSECPALGASTARRGLCFAASVWTGAVGDSAANAGLAHRPFNRRLFVASRGLRLRSARHHRLRLQFADCGDR